MFYGATPRVFDDDDRARVACTRCDWVSPELRAAQVQVRQAVCGSCGRDVDRYMVYAPHERPRASRWLRKRFGPFTGGGYSKRPYVRGFVR